VERRCTLDEGSLRRAEPEHVSNERCGGPNASGVLAGVIVTKLSGEGEALERPRFAGHSRAFRGREVLTPRIQGRLHTAFLGVHLSPDRSLTG
jgi:hypothetical protein